MQRSALILWGGWPGHFPQQGAEVVAALLAKDGFVTTVTPDYTALTEAARFDLIVQVITNDQIDPALVQLLTDAVRSATGWAGYHGGLAASFHAAVKFHYLTGVHWVAHPGDRTARHRVNVTQPDDPIMQGIGDFDYQSEQYYVLYDPPVALLATTTFTGDHDPVTTGAVMPVVFKRRFGKGRIFYTALGPTPEELSHPQAREILRRGLSWAARGPEEI